ncbi:hypothetical protein SETIT_9G350000v2 [Setaria italica]|uniref:Uncharacterized protein n=1 Tax=Setaria italica TaxID=4555 RepID=A0A368SNW4_SETIT|nr:hypothetical protein SETIT_9G350000v2 [Setaria italica]
MTFAIEFSLRNSTRSPTWRASCRCFRPATRLGGTLGGLLCGATEARVRPHPQQAALAPPAQQQPLTIVPAPLVNEVTGLPLIICPYCKDVRLVVLTTMNSRKNLGKCFFQMPKELSKCKWFPASGSSQLTYMFSLLVDLDPTSCPMYKFEDEYEAYLRRDGYLDSTSLLDVVPELLQEIEDLRLGFQEIKEHVAVHSFQNIITRFHHGFQLFAFLGVSCFLTALFFLIGVVTSIVVMTSIVVVVFTS